MFLVDVTRLLRMLLVGVCVYVLLIGLLQVMGKRTLSKWNAFDFVVTIALGSVLATTIVFEQTPLLEGFAALVLLVGFPIRVIDARRKPVRLQYACNSQTAIDLSDSPVLIGGIESDVRLLPIQSD